MTRQATIHGSMVLVGSRGVLVRGPSGSGKSRLALVLIDGSPRPGLPAARLVADDRVQLAESHGRLVARPPEVLAGLIELRGVGIVARPFEPAAIVRLVVDLSAPDAARMPDPEVCRATVGGVILPRLAVAEGVDPLPALTDWLIRHAHGSVDPPSGR